jgi:NADH dehydrogenase FAD-containing subunit
VEIASELIAADPTRKVGLLTRGPRLLPEMPHRASQAAETFMRNHGVKLYFNTDYEPSKSEEVLGYDLVLDCTGFKYDSIQGTELYMTD